MLELLADVPSIRFVKGNHETYFVDGLPTPRPPWMSTGEVKHQNWTHAQLNSRLKSWVDSWPYQIDEQHDEVAFTMTHYGLRGSHGDFESIIKEPTAHELDTMFADTSGDVVCYGHHHHPSDITGERRYINVGSLGCNGSSVARFAVIDIDGSHYSVTYKESAYDDKQLFSAFEARDVPERDFIYKAFFGDSFTRNV